MANDYMAKLIADLEGSTMMREPEPMPIIYRFEGGDYGDDAGDYGSEDADFGLGGDAGGGGAGGGDTGGGAMDAVDAEAYAQAAIQDPDIPTTIEDAEDFYNLAPGTLGPQGVGRGGPGEFSGGPDDRASTIDALNRIFNKEGIPQEFVPYFNSLKDRGLSNEQAMATLAAAAGTPGGAQGLTSGY
jgi:hypothetical protein